MYLKEDRSVVEGGSHLAWKMRRSRIHDTADPSDCCDWGADWFRSEGAWLRASGLVKSFRGRKVVKGVAIEVRAGEVVGLLGPNGAGKTTIFDMMVGLCQPDEGDITFGGESVTHLPMYQRARRGIGYLPQESSVFRRLSVEHNVLAILEMLRICSRRTS